MRPAVVAGFGAGMFGASLGMALVPLLLLYYMTEYAGIPAATAGVLLAIPKFADLLFDPWIGRGTDRWARLRGSRASVIGWSVSLLPALLALLFLPLDALPAAARVAVLATLLVTQSLLTTAFAVAQTALAGDLAPDLAGRGTLLSARAFGATIAGLTLAALAPQLVAAFGGGRSGYVAAAMALAVLAALMLLLAWATARGTPVSAGAETDAAQSLWTALRCVVRNRPFLGVAATSALMGCATTSLMSLMPYVNQHLLQGPPQQLSALLSPLFAALLVGIAVTPWLLRRLRPLRLLAVTTLATLAGMVWLGAGPRNVPSMAGALGLIGIAGGIGTVVLSTLAVEVATRSAGQGQSLGLYLGLMFSADKLGQSGGGMVAGFGVAWAGIGASAGQAAAPQAVQRLAEVFLWAPLLAMTSGLVLLAWLALNWRES
jgi:GPH family glycoside/pentoside/hexuronide:cation symporter